MVPVDEVGIVLPLSRLLVLPAVVHGNAEAEHRQAHPLAVANRSPWSAARGRASFHDDNSVDAHDTHLFFSCWGAGGAQRHVLLIAIGTLDDHMAHNGVIDAKNAIEFSNVSGIGMEIDESVVTVGQTVDLVSEFALAPSCRALSTRTSPSDDHVVLNTFITAARDSSSIDGATKNSNS